MSKFKDLTGQKFTRLTVLSFYEKRGKHMMWKCQCDCGKIRIVSTTHLCDGHTKSCGCYCADMIRKLNYKNGLSNTKLHYAYWNMIHRCYYKKSSEYHNYGERGIKVCDEWLGENGFYNFSNWALENGYDEKLTIDRIDNNGNYEPSNCRWATQLEQANNKRNTRYISVNGEIDTISNLARKYNVAYYNLLHYANGGKNCKYPNLKIQRVENNYELQTNNGNKEN